MKSITVSELEEIMSRDKGGLVVDVRTAAENRAVRIDEVINVPMESVADKFKAYADEKVVYVMCNSGNRSKMVCEDLALHGMSQLVNVEGGIQAWIQAGFPVIRTKRWAMPMMQQVMVIAGSLVLLGGLGSQFIHSNWVWLACGVGAGLTYAGLSGNCYMTKALALMPWNK